MKMKKAIAAALALCLLQLGFGAVSFAAAAQPVQVFDTAAGRVVKSVPNDAEFQQMARSWADSATGLAPQIAGGESCTHVFRVPLDKPVTVTAGGVAVTDNQVFLFYCKDKEPLLLMFDGGRKPYLFLFRADISPFIKKIGVGGAGR